MQIIFLPEAYMILSYFIGWTVFQLGAAYIGNHLPEKLFEAPWFMQKSFETEEFYKKYTLVHFWKNLLPDGGSLHKKGFPKKRLRNAEEIYLCRFILESKRAETVHLLAIFPFWIFGLWSPPIVIPIMLIYALVVNVPCIIAQRYNRPRLIRLREKKLELLNKN